jgi:hypothetical protein
MLRASRSRRTRNRSHRAIANLEPLESRQLLSASGLTLVETKSTLPSGALLDSTIKGAVTVQVTNSLTTTISGPQTFYVYGSLDGTIDSASAVLGSLSKPNLKLGAGKTTHETVPVKIAAPPAGDYEVFIEATDGLGDTSVAGKAPDLAVAAPYVSLSGTVGTPTPTDFSVDKTVTFKVTLTNNGNINSTGPLSATIELSDNGTTVATSLGKPQVKNPLTIKLGGKAVTLTYKAKVTDEGTFYIGATFTQGSQVLTVFSSTPINVGS